MDLSLSLKISTVYQMKIRFLVAFLFIVYGILIPFLADDFLAENFKAGLAIIGTSFIFGFMFLSGRVVLVNTLISIYVFRVYLIRPYINIFSSRLSHEHLQYIYSNDYFFNASDANVVYLSLFSFCAAWLFGILFAKSKKVEAVKAPRIFGEVDEIILNPDWRFWLTWTLLTFLNYQSPTKAWEGVITGESSGSFAYGLLSPIIFNFICLFAFMYLRHNKVEKINWLLIVPVVSSAVLSSAGGSRSAIFFVAVLALSYWFFLNCEKQLTLRDLKKIGLFIALSPIMIFAGLFAQVLRPLLRYGSDSSAVWEMAKKGLNFLDSNNAIVSTVYFGVTQLLHRLSSLQAQFLILNDHFIHPPWETYNPWNTAMGIFNDLMPGDPFPNLLTINQLFDYIYHDSLVSYNSETWGIQGTLYLYFGHFLSPIVVFCVAYLISRYYPKISILAKKSPAFVVFFMLFFNELIDYGTLERVIPNNIVRPLVCFFAVTYIVKVLKKISTFISKLKIAKVADL